MSRNSNPTLTAQNDNLDVAADFLSDAKADRSWYYTGSNLSTLKIDVETVWEDYTGEGVTVGVVDSQIEFGHSDLGAYDTTLDYNFADDTGDIVWDSANLPDAHGTMVAGIIAAEGGNGVGSVGVASGATLVGLAIDYDSDDVIDQAISALSAAVNVDVVNNSWSFSGNFEDNFNKAVNADMADTLETLAEDGRDGLGTAVVFSAGNAGAGGSSNYHNFQNSPYTITVGAVDPDGNPSSFTSLGANVLVSGPGREVLTTALKDRYEDPDGTSFSAPVVSGVVALMLEANPDLGYRDIQQILALSARREGLTDEALHGDGWQTNGATTHNGGGMHFSDAFGYGFVNAHDAVRLAETWTLQQTADNRDTVEVDVDSDQELVAGENDHVSVQFDVTDAIQAEHVQLSMDLRWANTADIDVYLTSPDGTQVRLVYDLPAEGAIGNLRDFTFTSVASMGELADGTWTLDIYNRDPDATAKDGTAMSSLLRDAQLTIHGRSDGLEDTTYTFTDEFGVLYSADDLAARRILNDTDGGVDTINAAAVTTDSRIDLSGAGETQISGITLDWTATDFENAVGGDGDDVLIGNASDNWIYGGRGADTVTFSAGADTIDGGAGDDVLVFNTDFAGIFGYVDAVGDLFAGFVEGAASLVSNIETFVFTDMTYAFVDFFGLFSDADPDVPEDDTPTDDPVTEDPTDDPVDEPVDDPVEDPVDEDDDTDTPVTGDPEMTLTGTDGNDKLRGDNTSDALIGADGDDFLLGYDGADSLYGDAGADKLRGGDGQDSLIGGAGSDTLQGENGNDILEGGADADVLFGGAGDDVINGGADADTLVGN
ncbi:S8 family serine peptidase, partial [Roseobacter sp.]